MKTVKHQPTGPSLTDVTKIGRQAVKFSLIGLVVLMVGRIFLSALVGFWQATHPEPPPPPTVGFGKLPPIEFPAKTEVKKPQSYTLETADGRIPSFGDRAKVFLMPKSSPSLLADEQVRQIAASYNFIFEPEVLDSRTYRWTKSQPLEAVFEIDVQNHNFTLTTDYLTRPELLLKNNLPDDFEAVSRVKTFLRKADLLPADVATAAGDIRYLKALGNDLGTAASLSDADFIEVNLNRVPVDGKYQMYTSQANQGTIQAIIAGALKGDNSIVQLKYYYHPVDKTIVETYPLRSSQQAWKILQAGEGYIVAAGEQEEAVIRQVELGYFDSLTEQQFLQPIYVFKGDSGFLGYVPALDPREVDNSINN
ncbi:MAG: hypothetical protein GF390_02335 [Candidatus Pacebacteria bacterium]|nr:hypothetical protein [Candidatus Paceibacterota bacterium]